MRVPRKCQRETSGIGPNAIEQLGAVREQQPRVTTGSPEKIQSRDPTGRIVRRKHLNAVLQNEGFVHQQLYAGIGVGRQELQLWYFTPMLPVSEGCNRRHPLPAEAAAKLAKVGQMVRGIDDVSREDEKLHVLGSQRLRDRLFHGPDAAEVCVGHLRHREPVQAPRQSSNRNLMGRYLEPVRLEHESIETGAAEHRRTSKQHPPSGNRGASHPVTLSQEAAASHHAVLRMIAIA
jgi:hypothetical protein